MAAVALFPMVWMGRNVLADLAFHSGSREARAGRTRVAIRKFERAIVLNESHSMSLHALVELDPRNDASEDRLVAARRLRPAWVHPLATEFRLAWERRNREAMRASLEKLREADPHGIETGLAEVRMLVAENSFSDATHALARVAAVWPGNIDVLLERAQLYEHAGRPESVRGILLRILRVYPEHEVAKTWLRKLGP